jgi:hypothetical protein
MPVILALRRLRQENLEFEASLGYITRACLKKTNRQNSYGGENIYIYLNNRSLIDN